MVSCSPSSITFSNSITWVSLCISGYVTVFTEEVHFWVRKFPERSNQGGKTHPVYRAGQDRMAAPHGLGEDWVQRKWAGHQHPLFSTSCLRVHHDSCLTLLSPWQTGSPQIMDQNKPSSLRLFLISYLITREVTKMVRGCTWWRGWEQRVCAGQCGADPASHPSTVSTACQWHSVRYWNPQRTAGYK